jgi:hypothetical protein
VFLALTLAAAAGNATLQQRSHPLIAEHRTARYAGTILDRIGTGDGSTELTVALDVGPTIAARVHGDVPEAGARVILRGRLEPFDEARNPDEPSEREIEGERGLGGRLDGSQILGSASGSRWEPRSWLARAHEWAHAHLSERLGEPAASLVAGELWGERGALPPALRTEFQETGTVHILVTAGLHLGAVAALCGVVLTLLAPPRWVACATAIILVWIFVWWSGAQLPAVRAAVMATAALAARVWTCDLVLECVGACGARPCIRTSAERRDEFVRALVFVCRRDLRLCGADRALDRCAYRVTQPST